LLTTDPSARLSSEESAELSARLATLAHSGLPLEGGLRALADEVFRPRLAAVLRNLAQRLERGEKLETAMAAPDAHLPVHLRGLIVAGVRSGRLALVLDQVAELVNRQRELRRRLLLAFAYPIVLLGVVAALVVLCHFYIVHDFRQLFRDFGMKLPDLTEMYLDSSGATAAVAVGLVIVAAGIPVVSLFLPLSAWLGRLLPWIPIVGPMIVHERHAQFAILMSLWMEENVPLAEALRLTSTALEGSELEQPCRRAASCVEEGAPLAPALADSGFPPSLSALVSWGESKNSLAESFRAAAEMFEARSHSQSAMLKILVLPLVYLSIISYVGLTIVALLMPLVSLISNLSGGK
jgi:general secretion pathway protein F